MRLLFITNPDGNETALYAGRAIGAGHDVAAVMLPLSPAFLARRMRKRPLGALLRIPVGRRLLGVLRPDLRSTARRLGFRLHYVWSLDSARAQKLVRRLQPDLVVTAALSHIVPSTLIRMAPLGGMNIHCGTLPAFGGVDSAFWTLHEHRPSAQVTFHSLSERPDSGIIYRRTSVRVLQGDTPERLSQRLIQAATDALPSALNAVLPPGRSRRPTVKSRLRRHPTKRERRRLARP